MDDDAHVDWPRFCPFWQQDGSISDSPESFGPPQLRSKDSLVHTRRHVSVGALAMTLNVYPRPAVRRLRICSFDPALAACYDLDGVSCVTIELPWEDYLKPGPVGEYLVIADVDPDSNAARR